MKRLLAGATCAIGLAVSAQAHLNLVGYYQIANIGNPAAEAAWIQSVVGGSVPTFLGKYEYPGPGGPAVWANGALSPAQNYLESTPDGNDEWDDFVEVTQATVAWDLTSTDYAATYVLAKDGAVPGGSLFYYGLFRVTDAQTKFSDGDIVQVNAAGNKGISHVSWFGGLGTTTVPDGGATAALLGLGMLGLGFVARRKA